MGGCRAPLSCMILSSLWEMAGVQVPALELLVPQAWSWARGPDF